MSWLLHGNHWLRPAVRLHKLPEKYAFSFQLLLITFMNPATSSAFGRHRTYFLLPFVLLLLLHLFLLYIILFSLHSCRHGNGVPDNLRVQQQNPRRAWILLLRIKAPTKSVLSGIGVAGFELATSASLRRRSNQAEPHPVTQVVL